MLFILYGNTLPGLCSMTGWFESNRATKPDNRCPLEEAQIIEDICISSELFDIFEAYEILEEMPYPETSYSYGEWENK